MIIDTVKKTIDLDSQILISEFIDELESLDIDFNEYKINQPILTFQYPKQNGTGTGDVEKLPLIPDTNKITVSY